MKRKLDPKHFRVAIFGSARITEKDESYLEVYKLSRLLGKRGISVITGGGPGIMDAANRGHEDGDPHNRSQDIGLNITLPFEQSYNTHLDVKKEFDKFSERLDEFMFLSNAIVVAPAGGIGTLLELFYAWQLVQVEKVADIPIIIIGRMWYGLITWIKRELLSSGYINEKDLHHIYSVKDHIEAFEILEKFHQAHLSGKKWTCKDYSKHSVHG